MRRLGSVERVLVASRLSAPQWPPQSARRSELARHHRRSDGGAVTAAVAGLGIATTGLIASRHELESGSLTRVLPDRQMGSVDVHAVFPSGRAAKAAARSLAERVSAAFRE
ncbi:MAG: hypothetical protein E6K47_12330 [Gammaproteobacteria bacterium]|nr:MAG: hypothetical protein E6K47_12330 [Gammaproteobacteria bacterium]